MRLTERRRLRALYQFRCGYCGVSETEIGAELTVDHFHPVSRGGSDSFDNLVYACHACNEFKGDYWQPDSDERVLHPLQDDTFAHLLEAEGGEMAGLTPSGRFHISLLQLNRRPLIAHRVWHRRQTLAEENNRRLEERLHLVEERLRRLEQRFHPPSDTES